MSQLTADLVRDIVDESFDDLPVEIAVAIYEGSAVGRIVATGYHRQLAATDQFAGFAVRKADNSDGVAGAINVRVRKSGRIVLPISSFAITDVGKNVYATDGNTFTLTPGTGTLIGKAVRFDSTGYAVVEFKEQIVDYSGYKRVFAGEHTTEGGNAAEAVTVEGVKASDLVLATPHTAGGTARTLLTAVATDDTITFTFSGDPSTTHVVTYVVYRAIP